VKGFLLDTNCVSELVRVRPESRVVEWFESTEESILYLSVLTFGEIRKGLASLAPSRKRASLESWLEADLNTRFQGRVLPVDQAVADRWGWLAAEAKRRGKPLAVVDGLLAATALQHNLTLVSRNTADFHGVAVDVFNPWEN
jgi:predicted nucleic acid-binding protein